MRMNTERLHFSNISTTYWTKIDIKLNQVTVSFDMDFREKKECISHVYLMVTLRLQNVPKIERDFLQQITGFYVISTSHGWNTYVYDREDPHG